MPAFRHDTCSSGSRAGSDGLPVPNDGRARIRLLRGRQTSSTRGASGACIANRLDLIAGRLNKTKSRTLLIASILALTAVAVAVRVHDLGALSFFGDEETTAFAARSVAEGLGSEMPSGMPYRRALPYTWLNALSAHFLGLDSELAYRLPAALIGALTVPLLYFVTTGIAGPGAGLLSALLLALSGWHLVWSRTARMYAPLLFVALAFFAVSYRWQRTGHRRTLVAAFLLYLLAVFLHSAGGAIALFPILFALLYDSDRVRARNGILVAILMGVCGWLLDRLFVVAPYERWASGFSTVSTAPAGQLAESILELTVGLPAFALLLALIGLFVGIFWARRAVNTPDDKSGRLARLAIICLGGLTVSAGFAGLPWAAVSLGLAALLLEGHGWKPWWSPRWVAVAAIGTTVGTTARFSSSPGGLREIGMTPFPYLPYLGRLLPGLVFVFVTALLWLALRGSSTKFDDRPLRVSVLFVLGYCLALGFARDWAPWRYLLLVYPWILLVVAAAIQALTIELAERSSRLREETVATVAVVLILAGLLGGHGVPATLRVLLADHGTSIPWNDVGMEIRPDHRGPGLFVRNHLRPGDVVIAEDALEQRWYTGQVNRWFRSPDDARKFLFRDTKGQLRDIYVGALLQDDPPGPKLLDGDDRAVWLITSGETALSRSWYLSPEQANWLDGIEATLEPEFEGADGLAGVYCFGRCPLNSADE